jgi:murein L,D-transpeptidase YcbB/YkuD
MNRFRFLSRSGLRGRCGLAVLLLAFVAQMAAAPQTKSVVKPRKGGPTLGEPASTVRTLILSKRLSGLRWPDISDFAQPAENFYRPSNYSLAWIQDSHFTPRAKEMIGVLATADDEGLNPDDYDGPRWPQRIAQLESAHTPEDEARFDAALTICAMRYISAVRLGRVNPKHLKFGFDVEHKRLDLSSYLTELAHSSSNLDTEISKIEPPFPGYQASRRALNRYMELAKHDQGSNLPPSLGTVHRLGYYDHMPDLVKRLRQLGDMPEDAVFDDKTTYYDEPLMSAVKHFQQFHGLKADGNLTPETIEQINIPLSFRVDQLRLTLEHYRWLPLGFSQPPIVVNIPEFRLRAFDADGRVGLTMKVNVGDAYDFQTPVFQNTIRYLVFRPYWNVPPRILRDEEIPSMEEDPEYLHNSDMEVVDRNGKVVASGEVSATVLRQLKSGSLGLRQKPGPDNALGLLKIIFPNEHHVYLHDTPESRDMFSSGQGALSHGCIHLEEPAKLAYWLLRDKPEWTEERVQQAMHDGRDNLTVNLTKPVPILIVYATAIAPPDGGDGEVHFFNDVYGHDATLKEALAKGYPYP